MSVTIRPYRRGGWEVDIRVVTPDGARQLRERRRAPMSSRSAAMRWAESRERTLFQRLVDPARTKQRKEVPTLRAFAPRFLDGHARANRQKPSGIVQTRAKRASRKAGLTHDGVHILRHSFCSHLAMRGAPARAGVETGPWTKKRSMKPGTKLAVRQGFECDKWTLVTR